MSTIRLEALRPDSPLGFLAALGVLRLATDELALGHPRLGWPAGTGGPAELVVDGSLDLASLAAAIFALVEECRATGRLVPGLDGFPPNTKASSGSDPMRSLTLADGRDLARQTWNDPALDRWLAGLVATGAPDDGALVLSQLLTAGPGTVWLERTLRGLLDLLPDAESIVRSLSGWRRTDSIGAYLDARADVSAARSPATKGAATKYGEPGASWLAIMALPVFASRSTPNGRATVGWRRVPGRTYFRYPVWREPVSLAVATALVDHPAIASIADRVTARDRERAAALRVTAIMESERQIAGNYNGPLAEPIDLLRVGGDGARTGR